MNGPVGMGMHPATGGPVGGAQMMQQQQQQQQMGQGERNLSQLSDLQARLNTYIYDHFVQHKQYECARTFKRFNSVRTKSEPVGTTPLEQIPENVKRPDDIEDAELTPHHGEHSFLLDWFCMFWDTYKAARNQPTYRTMSVEYMHQQRMRSTMMNANDPNKARAQMGMNGMKGMQQRNPTQEALMRSRAMQMQPRDGQMDPNGQRPQTPGSMGENAPSPSKRPRLENGADIGGPGMQGRPIGNPMLQNGMEQQMPGFGPPNGQPKMDGMNGMANSMAGQGMESSMEFIQNRNLGGNPQDGRHALQDYQLQLMLLEQQNKKRLLQARREQDTSTANGIGVPGPPGPPGPGSGPGGIMSNGIFAPNMSPQGSRGGGPSPNPADMKRETPKMSQAGLPGSPMPDAQQRGSPGGPGFDQVNGQIPPGMPANYYQQVNTMRQQPQTSHPNYQMQVPGMNAQQIDQMNRLNSLNHMQNGRLPNGQMPPGPQNMAFQAQNAAMAAAAQQQRQGNMAPPPAPADGSVAQPPQRAQESSPAQSAAPPTPSQTNKAAPKKKETAAQKKKNAPKKGAGATAATPTESADAPVSTPATPMTPSIRDTFPKSGPPPATATQAPPAPAAPVPQIIDHNAMFEVPEVGEGFNLEFAGVGSTDVLDNFDFDSFLTSNDDTNAFNFEGMDMGAEIGSGNV